MSPKPLRVAILCYRDDAISGGSLRVAEVIAHHLDPRRVEAHLVFAYGGPGPISKRSTVPCHYLEGHGPADVRAWARARKTLRIIDADILHFMDNVVWLQAAVLGTGRQRVVHVHGPVLPADAGGLTRIIWRLTKLRTAHHICISHGTQENLATLRFSTMNQSSVVHNSVDCQAFSDLPGKRDARESLKLPTDALLLGMVCRLVPNKGCMDLLSVLRRLPPKWNGVLCGDGPQRAELESCCRNLNLDGRVHFLGTQDDVRPVYATLDAYAFLSRFESFGLTIAEAMAADVPVFGFAGDGGYREAPYHLVRPDTAALVEYWRPYASADPASPGVLGELAAVITDYGDHPEKYRPMIERAGTWVRACFDAPLQAEAITRVYEWLTDPKVEISQQLTELYDAACVRGSATLAALSPARERVTEVA